MGFKYTDAAFKCRAVRGMNKYVLLLLCERANNETGVCWPSLRTIAADGGVSKDTVLRSVRELVRLGILEILVEGHERKSNRYRVRLEAMSLNEDIKAGEVMSSIEDAAVGCDTQRSAGRTEPVNETVPEPVSLEPITFNQSINQSTNQAPASPSLQLPDQRTKAAPATEQGNPDPEDLALLEDMLMDFPKAEPSASNLRLYREVLAALEGHSYMPEYGAAGLSRA